MVDDEPVIRAVVAEILALEGFHVATAANGREALEMVARDRPGVIVLDLWMPVLDGIGFARGLSEAGVDVPIVVMSAAPDACRVAREIGARACIPKPFELDQLIDTVRSMHPHA